jgi:ectoine hydroxylase-related dioxygenase (phytanoyl-CoA dioxygenase family)
MRSRVAMRAGDLLIWSTLLPHGNGHNVSQRPRLAQYIAMHVTEEGNEAKRRVRINCWRNRLPPPDAPFPGDPRKIEEQLGRLAELTPLG